VSPVSGPVVLPGRLPLTGADCFLRAFDAEIRRFNGASHISQLVLRLGPGFDVGRFTDLVNAAADAQPMLRAAVRRRFGVGAPFYELAGAFRRTKPEVVVHDLATPPDGDAALPPVFAQRLNERRSLRRGELLRFDVVRYKGGEGGSDLAMSWLHQLFDGAGSEHFVRWLSACDRGKQRLDVLPQPGELSPAPPSPKTFGERGDAARRWQVWVDGFGAHPLRSLAGPRRRTPQALGCDLITLDESQTEFAVAEAGRRAGFMTPMLFYMAAAIRAHHAVARARGFDPVSYVVPLPVNVRPRGLEAAIFRTHVSLVWFQVLPEVVDDFDALVAELKSQRLAAIKAGHIENGLDAMSFARFAPAWLYTRMARSASPGEVCSFFFAYTGEFLSGESSFIGSPIRNAFHVAPVPASPGSCAAMSLREGRLNVSHVHQRGVFSDEERVLFGASLRSDLCGGG
jgi:hypothetical protein